MAEKFHEDSRVHDLLAASLGAFAAMVLISSPWNVDTSGPDPFYKGPLIFPILILSLMILASLPAVRRLMSPPEEASWRLDGQGRPYKTLVVLGLLSANLFGLRLIGLEASTFLFLLISIYYLRHRRPLVFLLTPLVVTGLVVLVFKHFLQVWFPTPLLVEWLGG